MAATRRARSVARHTTALAVAVPAVMAHRLTRVALAGPAPSARDRKEFALMASEKSAAFQSAWTRMTFEMMRAHQALALRFFGALWTPSFWTGFGAARQLQDAALGVWGAGLRPLQQTAVANARRLAKTPLR